MFTNNRNYWKPLDFNKKLSFIPGPEILVDDKYFAFNTHIRLLLGTTMIFHNISGQILLTPLDKLAPDNYIMWVMKNW